MAEREQMAEPVSGCNRMYLRERDIKPVPSPAREDQPRFESPIGNFNHPQEDYLVTRQKGQSWTWYVIRPEAIIGYTSKPNGMNSALTFALCFLVCKHLGTEANMPTNQLYWEGSEDISDSRLIADMTIWASTTPEAANEASNVTNGDYFCWRYMWPRVASYFDANATSDQVFKKPLPSKGDVQLDISLAEWAIDKKEVWDSICDENQCPEAKATWDAGTWAFQD